MNTLVEASCRVYRVVLYVYPYRLREEFGADMVSVFEQQLLDARSTGGPLEICRIWARALWETVHLVRIPCPAPESCGLAIMSLLSSSALFVFLIWAAGWARHCVK